MIIKKIPERILFSSLYLVISAVTTVILGFLFGLFLFLIDTNGDFLNSIRNGFSICFFMLSATFAVAGLLTLITKIPWVLSMGFGAGLYYGTVFVAGILRDCLNTSDINLYFISGLIVALICYIVWLKYFKDQCE